MASTVHPGPKPNVLRARLASVRRRLHVVACCRGLGLMAAVVLLTAATCGLLDWRLHLPGLVRALFLVGGLAGAGVVAYRYLFQPLSIRADDLSLALRIEDQYPGLNDCLASTVQFLEQTDDSAARGSAALRLESIRRALGRTRDYDFTRIVDARGVRTAGTLALASAALAGALLFLYPTQARTAMERLANPFGGVEWPRQTLIDITTSRFRIGKNEPYEIKGIVRGLVPEKAGVSVRFDGSSPEEHVCELTPSADTGEATFVVRLERGKVQRNFSFRARANDALTPWFNVSVVPPPTLVPLDGRPSPQVRLDYPAYAELQPLDRPDGTGDVVAVAGTRVTLRARADRPLQRAWITYHPDLEQTDPFTFLNDVGREVHAELDATRTVLQATFEPRFVGSYALHFEDETELSNQRFFEVRVAPDPAPLVDLERPSASRESLNMLPSAGFALRAQVHDLIFALRSVYLEYRCGKDEQPRRLPLYDADLATVQSLLTQTPGGARPTPAHWRLQHAAIDKQMSLKLFRHPDGSALKVGDVLTLQLCADDFDDVAIGKPPGRSHEVEIHIIDQNALEVELNQEQAKIQQELVKLREQERSAIKKVTKAQADLDRSGKLDSENLDQIAQAEQIQQQIREKVGSREEGLRADVAKIRQTLKDNELPRGAVHERIDEVAGQLDRLARDELQQIEPALINARKHQETAPPGERNDKSQPLLKEAQQHQNEVERTLDALLSRLEPWSSTLEYKGEAKSILQDQRQLNRETEDKNLQGIGEKADSLPREKQNELERLQEGQKQLQDRTGRLLDKMERLAKDREKSDEQTANEMREAVKQGKDSDLTGQMKTAAEEIKNNNLGAAGKTQRNTIAELEKLVKTLEDRREAELDRLSKKLRELEKKLDELTQRQEDLQKKIREASALTNPQERENALKRLARQQRELAKDVEKTQNDLRQLSRFRADQAGQAMSQASEQMEQAAQRLERGQQPEEQTEEALDRLDEAQREMQQARTETEEELAREQLAKVADVIKRLKERHDSLIAEAERIQNTVNQNKTWSRPTKRSLSELAQNQKALADDVGHVADEKLSAAIVFARALKKSAATMNRAAERFEEQHKRAEENANDIEADAEAIRSQQEARTRLDQLLDLLKSETGSPMGRPQAGAGGQGEQPDGGGRRGDSDAIPDVLQLKLLRAMQVDVNKHMADFHRLHPDPEKLTQEQKDELQTIRQQQQEIADLLDELIKPAKAGGDMP